LVTHDFDVSPSAPFGATVRGLDHVALPEGESPDALRRLLDDHGLLVFPDADVDDAFQIELTALPVRHEESVSRGMTPGFRCGRATRAASPTASPARRRRSVGSCSTPA
jgi:alpha-ketoglutarate-dependent taurine dioxygenase